MENRKSKNQKVVVAMSGGVDSSVAAALLKRAGFNVVGVFMKLFREANPTKAKKVAKKLGIPFKVLDFQKEFKRKVIDYFLREYRHGLTPNPCVVCNKDIKFGLLLEKSLALDADYVATGHYARLRRGRLFRAGDKEKDQSYFLWQLNQNQLKHILFPVGDYTKVEVRNLAKKLKLPTSNAPESMEICFVRNTINDFLSRYIKPKPGRIIDKKDERIGRHQGLAFYTVGQRKGIGLSGGPYWVLDKDLKRNLLIVTKNEKDLLKKELNFKNANWISGKKPKFPLKVRAKIRYRHKAQSATIVSPNKLIFVRPQRAITPGQSVVFYKNDEVLGGAVIR